MTQTRAMSDRPTLHDVGALAGVTARTVSRVINREPGVSERTAIKVQRAIADLNFRPNLAARALRSDRSLLIAIVKVNPWPRYVAEVIRGASMACREAGTILTFEEFSPYDGQAVSSISNLLDNFGGAGLILMPPLSDDPALLDMLDRRQVKTVRLSPSRDIGRGDAVVSRDQDGIAALVDHLVALGHRRFGYISGIADHSSSQIRLAAFKERLLHHRVPWTDVLFEQGDFSFESGTRSTRNMLAHDRAVWPTAICAANDEMAAGVISVLADRGIRMPDEVAVSGFDDNDISRLIWPPLTTVRQSIADQAYSATQLLVDRTQDVPRCIEHGVELIIRRSTAGNRAN